MTNLDLAVGRVVDTLDELDLADDTMVLFTSDNGPEMVNRHPQAQRSYGSAGNLRGKKLQLWEGGIRVPFIVRWPGKTASGEVSKAPVSGIDLLPTLAELAGVPLPTGLSVDGESLAPAITGGKILGHQWCRPAKNAMVTVPMAMKCRWPTTKVVPWRWMPRLLTPSIRPLVRPTE